MAETYLLSWSSASKPVLVRGNDGLDYVVKGAQAGRMVFNDQVVGRLAAQTNAPVPEVSLIDVPADLINAQPEMKHLTPGLAHGSVFVPGCSERENQMLVKEPANLERFAELAVIYGWISANDHQFIYKNDRPALIFSVDHGHFFPGGPNWSSQSLAAAPPPKVDSKISGSVVLEDGHLQRAADQLAGIDDAAIADVVQLPPAQWGNVSKTERNDLIEYLRDRRDLLVETIRKV